MNEITIREYIAEDWTRLRDIHDEARKNELQYADLSEAFIPFEKAAYNEGLFEYTVCVACMGETVVGFAAYSEDELAWLYVDPLYMGQGVGKSLVNYVVNHTIVRPLNVEVLVGNSPAIKLYEACGFQLVETALGQMVGNEGFHISAHIYQKK